MLHQITKITIVNVHVQAISTEIIYGELAELSTPSLARFLGYVKLILDEVMQLRSKHNTVKKAKKHAKNILPREPCSLVLKYLKAMQKQFKEDLVAAKRSRFSKPALPSTQTVKKKSMLV